MTHQLHPVQHHRQAQVPLSLPHGVLLHLLLRVPQIQAGSHQLLKQIKVYDHVAADDFPVSSRDILECKQEPFP